MVIYLFLAFVIRDPIDRMESFLSTVRKIFYAHLHILHIYGSHLFVQKTLYIVVATA